MSKHRHHAHVAGRSSRRVVDDHVRHHLNQVVLVDSGGTGLAAQRFARTRNVVEFGRQLCARPLCRLTDWRGESAPRRSRPERSRRAALHCRSFCALQIITAEHLRVAPTARKLSAIKRAKAGGMPSLQFGERHQADRRAHREEAVRPRPVRAAAMILGRRAPSIAKVRAVDANYGLQCRHAKAP